MAVRQPASFGGPVESGNLEPGRRRAAGVEYAPIVVEAGQHSVGREDRLVSFEPGDVLFGPGDHLAGAFCVVTGRVELVLEGKNCRELVLVSAGPGALVGEDYVLSQAPSLLWAVAASPVTAVVYSREKLLRQMCADPELAQSLLLSLAKKLETTTIRLHNVTFMNLECRIAKLLLAGVQVDTELGEVTYITHSEIARCTGSCRVAVSRTLQKMQKAGMVELRRGCIKLVDSSRLSHMACALEDEDKDQ